MQYKIDETEFVIFDTETTGLDPASGDRVVEIAAMRLVRGKEEACFQSLANPHRPVSEAAFAVNGISSAMLDTAPEMEEVLPAFLEFIKGGCLCSYNAPFDMGFLQSELKRAGLALPAGTVVIDILKMARRLMPGLERYALWFVAQRLGVQSQQLHRALSDVRLTWEVMHRLIEIARLKGIDDQASFTALFGLGTDLSSDLLAQRLATIQEAIDLGLRLTIKYLSGSSAQVTERQVLPKEVRQESGRTYLVGHCFLRNEERSFRVDNILHIALAGSTDGR